MFTTEKWLSWTTQDYEKAIRVLSDAGRAHDIRYVKINRDVKVTRTDQKSEALSFQGVCRIMERILFNSHNLTISSRKDALEGFKLIKDRFQKRTSWISYLFFWNLWIKSAQVKEAEIIIKKGEQDLVKETKELKEEIEKKEVELKKVALDLYLIQLNSADKSLLQNQVNFLMKRISELESKRSVLMKFMNQEYVKYSWLTEGEKITLFLLNKQK